MLGESFQNIWQQILMIDEKAYENFLSFSMTIATTLLSVGVSVFTLTTAFIVSKKDSLNELGTQVEEGGQSLTLARRMNALQKVHKNHEVCYKDVYDGRDFFSFVYSLGNCFQKSICWGTCASSDPHFSVECSFYGYVYLGSV